MSVNLNPIGGGQQRNGGGTSGGGSAEFANLIGLDRPGGRLPSSSPPPSPCPKTEAFQPWPVR